MAEGFIELTASRIKVHGINMEADVPVGMHITYKPDDGSTGRTGNLNFIPGQDTGDGNPGSIQEGLSTDENGEVHLSVSKRMVVNKIPGMLQATVYQSPELLGQNEAFIAIQHVTS